MKQITEDYCSFEVAKLLKDRFDGRCYKKYNSCGDLFDSTAFTYGPKAPTHQMAMKWLREEHQFIITINYDRYACENDISVGYGYNIQTKDKPEEYYKISESVYDTYEEACEAVIKYCLTNLI